MFVCRVFGGLLLSLVLLLLSQPASAVIRDGGIDPANLGKGDWIYYMSMATNKLGGNVASVTNEVSLMKFYKSVGVRYIIVKAATSDQLFKGSYTFPQFTSNLCNVAHAEGILVFGYNRSYGANVNAEIGISDYVFRQGADGFVWDAEAEWESNKAWIGTNGPALAWQLCSTVRSNWPNKLLVHAPFPIISYHMSFPYKEFGYWCDVVMPQIYPHNWTGVFSRPSGGINWTDVNWQNWQESLYSLPPTNINGMTVHWTNSIKPLAPVNHVYGPNPPNSGVSHIPDEFVMEFVDYLAADPNSITAGGYKGANFWRADLHGSVQWTNIRPSTIGDFPGVVNNIVIDDPNSTRTGAWAPVRVFYNGSYFGETGTDINPFGTNYLVKAQGTGTEYVEFTPNVLVSGEYDLYEWHVYRADASTNVPFVINYDGGSTTVYANQTTNAGKWSSLGRFAFAAGTSGTIRVLDSFSETNAVAVVDGLKMVFVPVPAAPSDLTATPINAAQIDLTWVDNASDETGFMVARSTTNGGPYLNLAAVSVNATNYSDQTCSAGTTYYYVVRALSDGPSSTNSAPAFATTPLGPPVIVRQPQSQTVFGGDTFSLDVLASATTPSYQWQFNSANIPGATTSVLTITNASGPNHGSYQVIVGGVGGAITSDVAIIDIQFSLNTVAMTGGSIVREPDLPTYSFNTSVVLTPVPDAGYAFVGWTGDVDGTNNSSTVAMDRHKNVTAYFMSSADVIVDNPQATYSGVWNLGTASADKYGTSYHYANSTTNPVTAQAFFRPNIPLAGKYNVFVSSPGGSSRTTNAQALIVYEGGTKTTIINQTALNSTYAWRKIGSILDFIEGNSGYVRLANNTGESNKLLVADGVLFSLVNPPALIMQPQSITVARQAPAKFGVLASGHNLLYQWQKNGTNIPGATATSYNIAAAQLADAGSYQVVINNELSSVTSASASLTVTVTAPHLENFGFTSDQNFQFFLSGEAGNYTIEGSSNLLDWFPLTNMSISSSPVLFIDSAATNFQSRFYRTYLTP